jgi:DNA polymerase-3 subunit alpha
MEPTFIHLRIHSEFSLVDGIVRIKKMIAALVEQGSPAVAITDQSNLFSMVKFYRASIGSGLKPIIGVDVWLHNEEDANAPFRLVLLAQNDAGYRNMTRLVSKSYQKGQHLGRPMLDRGWLEAESEGLIALSGGREGDVGRALLAGQQAEAERLLSGWQKLFGDRYYLELIRTGRVNEEEALHLSVELAAQYNAPVVATNDVRFLSQGDFDAHETRVCIHEGRTLDDPRRPKLYSEQQYLRSEAEMCELFADIPEALQNSVEIAKRCTLELELDVPYLPEIPIPEGMSSVDELLADDSRKGLEERLAKILDPTAADYAECRQVYDDRLAIELKVICDMGFPGYFLIVSDFIQWAKDNDIPVGPGRGSGAGSLVAYVLKITDLDPIEHELLFERFLNPERVSMPDFDIDFCMEGRDRVIDYVSRHYGRDSVSQIITYGTMAAKAVVRDVGRVMSHPYGFVDRIAKLIPFEIGMTLTQALKESDELKQLYDDDDEVQNLIKMALKLEGVTRNAGKHAGGVVISPTLLTDFSPLYCEPGGGNLVTQFDKNDVEAVGLVKFDFLGLRTLTIIDWALKTINATRKLKGEDPVDITAIPTHDKASFALLKRCETTAVFQLESRGMKELVKKLQPDSFEDITALVALYRPGPLGSGMVDDFIDRKHGRADVAYPHPDLEPILKPTYGVILYQEQVMQIAQVLAGYSLGGADLLRRAMGKKKQSEMDKQGELFRAGAIERGVDEDTATYIFDLMAKFAGYGFNKSHSAAYALVSYQTMWLKAHYPAAFMAAVLSADMDTTDKVVTLIEECRAMKLEVLPPDVNLSRFKFTIHGDNQVIYGLGAIKGVGESAIDGIVEAQEEGGKFKGLLDFCRRIDLKRANKRVLEALIHCGALDKMGENRATLMKQLPSAIRLAEQHHATRAAGQNDLFGIGAEVEGENESDHNVLPGPCEEWEDEQRLTGEKNTLGLYLTGHPIDRYEDELRHIVTSRIGDLSVPESTGGGGYRKRDVQRVCVAGLVMSIRRNQTQRGTIATLLLDDRSGRIEATLFSDTQEEYRDLLVVDKILVINGGLSRDDFRGGINIKVEQVHEFEQAREIKAKRLTISLDRQNMKDASQSDERVLQALAQQLKPFTGGQLPIQISLNQGSANGAIQLGDAWRIHPTDELLRRLNRQFSGDQVKLVWH